MATIRFIGSLIVQSQAVYVPANLLVGAPECRENPAACCPSGSGTVGGEGCCYPAPPARLWASLYGQSAACDCLATCFPLDHYPPEDAWFSVDPIADFCLTGVYFLRLKCVDGSYRLDVVGEDHSVVILEGVPAFDPACDPFLVAACFDDQGALVCPTPGQFCYFIVEAECVPPDEGGSGGDSGSGTDAGEFCLTIESESGDCDCLAGNYPLSSNGPGAGWTWVGEVCDSLAAAFSFGSDGHLILTAEGLEFNDGNPIPPPGGGPPPFVTIPVRGVGAETCEGTVRLTLTGGPCGGGGGGELGVACCASDLVPAALHAVFSEGAGDLVCLDGRDVPLSGIQTGPDAAQWDGTLPASCGLSSATLSLSCTSADTGWTLGCAAYGILGVPSSVSCLPFRLVFVTSATFAGSGTVKVTITPA